MNQEVKIKLKLNAEGIKKAEDDLKRVNRLKQQLETPGGSLGGSAAARSVPKSAAFKDTEYGTARGTIGTGAEGRDFAKQSQGLGGVVRLYATIAANLFAATAAFNALKDAMATTNMIEGLNQLGAQSGQSLGTLAKNFADASGGAISLRDAMQATVQATSAGLSTKQFSQLGDVARKASVALGRDMADSVSRLTRGITKLEPELLDELGIFAKVGKATEDYAKSVGKSVSSLTDFERRQAFANAVLQEGLDKFGSIDIPANPYDKLLASLKNVAQAGLETVNKVLGPLVNLLSSSPQGLTVAIAALGTLLLKQAIPAIGQYRQGLKDSAESASLAAGIRANEAKQAAEKRAMTYENPLDEAAERALAAKKVAEADLKIATSKVTDSLKEIEDAREKGFRKGSRGYEILKKSADKLDETDVAFMKQQAERFKNRPDVSAKYTSRAKDIEEAISASNSLKTATDALTNSEAAYQAAVAENDKKLAPGIRTAAGRAQLAAKRAADRAASRAIVSGAAESTAILGPVDAFKEMNKALKESDMNPIRKGFTRVSAVASIASTAIMGVVGALQTWIFIIGAAVAGIKMFDAWMTKNADQSEAYKKAVSNSEESLKNYDRTIKSLAKTAEKNGGAVFSTAGITAQANAFKELVDNLSTVREKFEELDKATTGWDKFWDGKFGASQGESFAETTVANISKTIAAIRDPEMAANITQQVSGILGTSGDTSLEWIEALKKGGPEAAAAVKLIEDRLKPVSTALSITASRSKEFDDQLKKLGESYRAFAFSVIDKSPMSALGDDMISFAEKTIGALKDTETGLASMSKLMEDNSKLAMFSPDVFMNMQNMKSEVQALNKLHGETAIKLTAAKQAQQALQLEYDKAQAERLALVNTQVDSSMGMSLLSNLGVIDKNKTADALITPAQKKAKQDLDAAIKKIEQLNKETEEQKKQIDAVMSSPVFKQLAIEAFEIGAGLITKSVNFAFQKANIDLRRTLASGLNDLVGSAAIQNQIDADDIKLQRDQLEMTTDMTKAQYLSIAAQEKAMAALELTKAQAAAGFSEEGASAEDGTTVANRAAMLQLTDQFSTFVNTGGKDAAGMMKILTTAMGTFGTEIEGAPAVINAMAQAIKGFLSEASALALIGANETRLKREGEFRKFAEEREQKLADLAPDELALIKGRAGVAAVGQQNAFTTPSQVAAQAGVIATEAIIEFRKKQIAIDEKRQREQTDINLIGKGGESTAVLQANLDDKVARETLKARAERDAKLTQAGTTASVGLNKALAEEQERRLNIRKIIAETNTLRDSTTNELNELELEYQIKLGAFSEQQIADAKNIIETTKLQTETRSKLITLELNYLSAKNKLEAEARNAAPGVAGEAIRQNSRAEIAALTERFNAEVAGVNSVTAAKLKMLELDASISERQKAYEDIFKRSFEGMGDAIVDFVKTGKLEFSSLISSMLEDIARYEIKQQAMALYQSVRPEIGTFASFIGKAIGSMSGSSTAGLGNEFGDIVPSLLSAKGNAFDYGIEKFAKGGAFSNQIVDSPTLFKFAKGTGMMGEAGPEAIMPLKRDAQGNLGVRSGQTQTNVDVVVNNYGSEQATTTETTDSRGNRRIEVTIGDMTAGEMGRSGSASQRSLRNTYGLQPQLIRR